MGRFDNIKTAIDTNINTNGNQAITGAVMNSVMKQTVDSVDTQLTELESKVSKTRFNISASQQGDRIVKLSDSLKGKCAIKIETIGNSPSTFNLYLTQEERGEIKVKYENLTTNTLHIIDIAEYINYVWLYNSATGYTYSIDLILIPVTDILYDILNSDNANSSAVESIYGKTITLVSGYYDTSVNVGSEVSLSRGESAYTFSAVIENCGGGYIYMLHGQGGNSARLWAFLTEDKKLINAAPAMLEVANYRVAIPTNAYYCIVQSQEREALWFYSKKGESKDLSALMSSVPIYINVDEVNVYNNTYDFRPLEYKLANGDVKRCSGTQTFADGEDGFVVLDTLRNTTKKISSINDLSATDAILAHHKNGGMIGGLLQSYMSNGMPLSNPNLIVNGLSITGSSISWDSLMVFLPTRKLEFGAKSFSAGKQIVIDVNANEVVELNSSQDFKPYHIVLGIYESAKGQYTSGMLVGHTQTQVGQYIYTDIEITYNSVQLGGIYIVNEKGLSTISWQTKKFRFVKNGFLIMRNKDAMVLYSSSELLPNDIVLLVYRNKEWVAGALLGMYNSCKNELPKDITQYNVQRRSWQLKDIKWRALKPVANISSSTGIAEGEHIGLPYTSCMQIDKFVGYDVSIHTFMTMANNPYSLLYTEDLARNISEYGFEYYGGRDTIGGYCGIVCNIFANYAVGMDVPFDSGSYAYLAQQGILEKIYDQSAQGVQIGDLIWEPGHCNVVTDVKRLPTGEVQYIWWAESINDFPKRIKYTVNDFNIRLYGRGGIIYRYKDLYKNTAFTESQYIPFERDYTDVAYNDDICTFAGDKALFRQGQIIYLNYNLKEVKDWDAINLYKDGNLLETIAIDKNSHRLNLTPYNLIEGRYSACMVNKSTGEMSEPTLFDVMNAPISVTEDNGIYHVEWDSSKQPIFVRFCQKNGGPIAMQTLTDLDLSKGYVDIDLAALAESQYHNIQEGNVYCKVYYRGEYGRVTNEPILVA